MILSSATALGPYRIVAPLGSGGMGEVYRARDGRLGRDVALKVLREEDAEDEELLSRFEREARAASSLNHPNIVVVYEAGTASVPGRESPVHYLAMELIDGEPIADSLAGEPMPLRRFLDLATQLADGLARAHESGIVHRDLKPSNVFVTSEGRVKILDFGLAALRPQPGNDTQAPTAAGRLTSPGIAVGTLGYMSPEQARGEEPTPASDQFSLGCIYYEMLTGLPAFSRPSAAETFSAILRDEPRPVDESNPSVPQPLRWILDRCLAKSPRDRYASTRDLARDLQTIRDHTATTGVRVSGVARAEPRRRRPLWIGAAALAVAAAALSGVVLLDRLRAPLQPDFRRLTFRDGVVTRALFAPNGSILYAASWGSSSVRSYLALPESTGIDRALDSEVQFPLGYSADGSQVLVLVGPSRLSVNESGTLAWWPSLGGRPRRILDNAGWADVAHNGRFLAVVRDLGADRVLELRSAEGVLQRTLFRTGGAIWFARISPDDTRVAFVHYPSRFDNAGEIQVVAVDGSGSKVLTRRFERCAGLDWNAKTGEIWFSASAHTAYASGTIWTVNASRKLRALYVLPDFFALQSISGSGDRLLLTSQQEGLDMAVRHRAQEPRDLSWLGWTFVADISPDGTSVLFYDGGPTEKTAGVWIRPLDGGDGTRLGEGYPGKFSPDGRWVVAVTRPLSGTPQLVLIPVEAGAVRQLPTSGANVYAPSFAGPNALIFVRSEKGVSEVWTMETDGSGARSLGAAGCDMPMASPTGSSFLCLKGNRKRSIFVHSMKGDAGRGLYAMPEDDGFVYARWSRNGDRVFGVTRGRRLLTIDSATGALLRDEAIPLAETSGQARLIGAALDADAETRAYSTIRTRSDLYLASGIR